MQSEILPSGPSVCPCSSVLIVWCYHITWSLYLILFLIFSSSSLTSPRSYNRYDSQRKSIEHPRFAYGRTSLTLEPLSWMGFNFQRTLLYLLKHEVWSQSVVRLTFHLLPRLSFVGSFRTSAWKVDMVCSRLGSRHSDLTSYLMVNTLMSSWLSAHKKAKAWEVDKLTSWHAPIWLWTHGKPADGRR